MPCIAVTIEVSPGELIDKLTILQIKQQQISDPVQRHNVDVEFAALNAARQLQLPVSPELAEQTDRLRAINQRLWQVEDELRLSERRGDFGEAFIALARSVYQLNDQRAAVKRQINTVLGSAFFEEKSYRTKTPPEP